MTHQFQHPDVFYVGEPVDENEMRVTCLGSGMPYTRRAQAAASWLVELGNGEVFIFDLGTGATANLNAFQIPYNKMTKIFLTHLHVDHWGDLSALYAIGMVFGRTELTEVWGPSGKEEKFGTAAFGKARRARIASFTAVAAKAALVSASHPPRALES